MITGLLPGWEKIAEEILAANAAPITFNNIPADFAHLALVGTYQLDAGRFGIIRFNNDSGNNYDYLLVDALHSDTFGTGEGLGVSSIVFSPDAAGGSFGNAFIAWIPGYTGTTLEKSIIVQTQYKYSEATGNLQHIVAHGWWRSTAAITRIDLDVITADDFVTGSHFSLYGVH